MSKFKNKTILVTGASSGIGLAMAKDFSSRGANLILTARSKDKLDQLAKELEAQGTKTKVFVEDISVPNSAQKLYDQIKTEQIDIDILVNNAGISDGSLEIEDITEEKWDSVMDLNIKIIFFMIQKFLPLLRVGSSPETPRNVINIASIDGCGKINSIYNYAYGVSKAGLIQLDRHLGDRLAWEGIHLNTISPGDFPTDLNTTARDYTEDMKKVIPAKRVGQKENIAGAAIFLASMAGNYSVGSNIVIDGGESVRGIQRAFYAKIFPDMVNLEK